MRFDNEQRIIIPDIVGIHSIMIYAIRLEIIRREQIYVWREPFIDIDHFVLPHRRMDKLHPESATMVVPCTTHLRTWNVVNGFTCLGNFINERGDAPRGHHFTGVCAEDLRQLPDALRRLFARCHILYPHLPPSSQKVIWQALTALNSASASEP